MTLQDIYIAISGCLALVSSTVYCLSIYNGKTRPHRTTRFILLLDTCLSTASLFAHGDRVAVWLSGVSALQAIVIFALSIKYGMGGWSRSDIACLIIALIGIVLWQVTSNPLLALYFSILADLVGMVPAMIKTYRFPETEIWIFFALDIFAGIFSLLALRQWGIADFSYPLYIMLINAVMVALIVTPRQYSPIRSN